MNEVAASVADIYIQILGTSPFIEPDTIKRGINLLSSDQTHDSAVLVRKEKLYTWSQSGPHYNVNSIPNSVDLEDTIVETMGLYLIKREAAIQTRRRIGNSPILLEAKPIEAIDVNWPEDLRLANLIAAGLREEDRRLLQNVKHHISSSLLSDLLDDMGHRNQIIKGLGPNLENSKFLGRAKTLHLRPLEPNEDFTGIYRALQSYNTVVPNDVIMIENMTPEFAYFGELNSHLALRCGAAAVVVGGRTRDSEEVRRLGLPVFSTGYTCQDVRGRATTGSMNKKICIFGVDITPGDLVFGDAEGVVVIPQQIEKAVISEIFDRASNEKKILIDISKGNDVSSLVNDYGFF